MGYNNVEWIINHQKVDASFSSEIILSDETHFHIDGFVNRQNCHVWGSKNPCVISEKQTHKGSLFGADFGQEASSDHTFLRMRLVMQQAINGARYLDMITQFFLPKLDDIDVANMWFQQGSATCHTANETIQLLHEIFPGRVLSRFGD